jgi:CBS-domain-containing membrane protein
VSGDERHGLHGRLAERFGGRAGEAIYSFAACLLALVVSGLAAYLAKQPLLFPSLGPTALLFFERPMAATSSPRNALIGHAVAILAGARVVVLTVAGWLLNRAAGVPVPVWGAKDASGASG